MPATERELKRIAQLKILRRLPNEQIAAEIGVAPGTIAKWTRSAEYDQVVLAMRKEWKDQARARVASLQENVLNTLEDLMMYSKQDKIRFESARTLGEWLGLHEPEATTSHDDKEDLVSILRRMADQQESTQALFTPPLPGGILPGPTPSALTPPRQIQVISEKGEELERYWEGEEGEGEPTA